MHTMSFSLSGADERLLDRAMASFEPGDVEGIRVRDGRLTVSLRDGAVAAHRPARRLVAVRR